MPNWLNALLVSRKFWLAVFGVFTAIVAEYLNVSPDIWISIEVLVLAVIASLTLEDAALKLNGRTPGK